MHNLQRLGALQLLWPPKPDHSCCLALPGMPAHLPHSLQPLHLNLLISAVLTLLFILRLFFHSPLPHSPPPNSPPPPEQSLPLSVGAILQFNCNGISNSHDQLDHILRKTSTLVACIQESKLRPSSNFRDFPHYTAIRRDRPGGGGGGGLITLVHSSVDYIPLPSDHLFPNDTTTEHLAITAFINQRPLNIFNIYIPPTSSCPPRFTPQLDPLFQTQGDTLILGDFNAHHPSWYSSTSDSSAASRGEAIHEALMDADLALLNSDLHTRLPTSGNPSSPDLSIATPHIALDSDWSPSTTGNSDHLPIIIQLGSAFSMECPDPPRRTYTNFRKANWDEFTAHTEERFAAMEPPISCSTGEYLFRQVLREASNLFIPKGNIPNMIPNLSDSSKRLIRERDTIRAHSPTDPGSPSSTNRLRRTSTKQTRKHGSKEQNPAHTSTILLSSSHC